ADDARNDEHRERSQTEGLDPEAHLSSLPLARRAPSDAPATTCISVRSASRLASESSKLVLPSDEGGHAASVRRRPKVPQAARPSIERVIPIAVQLRLFQRSPEPSAR